MRKQIAKEANSTYRLDEDDRRVIAALDNMALWPRERIAKAYGVTARTVQNCTESGRGWELTSGGVLIVPLRLRY